MKNKRKAAGPVDDLARATTESSELGSRVHIWSAVYATVFSHESLNAPDWRTKVDGVVGVNSKAVERITAIAKQSADLAVAGL